MKSAAYRRRSPSSEAIAGVLAEWLRRDAQGRLVRTTGALVELIDAATAGRLTTVNLEHVYLAAADEPFHRALLAADWWCPDGWPLVLLTPRPGVERVTGKRLCADLTIPGRLKPLTFALLGSDEETCTRFSRQAEAAGHEHVWCDHRSLADMSDSKAAAELGRLQPRLVLVALGAAAGEIFASQLTARGCPGLVVQVGGGVGMTAGTTPSAPALVERLGLEWAFRLAKQPRRLWRRYLVQYPRVVRALLLHVFRRQLAAK